MPLGGLGLGLPFAGGAPGWLPKELGAGLKLWVRPEELNNPNQLKNTTTLGTGWNSQNEIVTPGQEDPFGGTDAVLVENDGATTIFWQAVSTVQPGASLQPSVWVKKGPGHGGTDRFALRRNDGTGVVTVEYHVPTSEWVRIGLDGDWVVDSEATAVTFYLYCDVDGTDPVYVYGPQLESGIAVSPYRANAATVGGIIASWPDQSGNGNHPVETTQSEMCLVQANVLDGYAGMLNDGVDDKLVSPADVTQPHEVWIVVTEVGTDTGGFYGPNASIQFQTTTQTLVGAGSNIAFAARTAGAHPRMIHVYYNGASSTMEMYNVDGAGSSDSKAGDLGASGITNIRLGWVSGGGWNGFIHEVVSHDGTVSAVNRAKMLAYLDVKYPSLGI
jgi:hypothetical protein